MTVSLVFESYWTKGTTIVCTVYVNNIFILFIYYTFKNKGV